MVHLLWSLVHRLRGLSVVQFDALDLVWFHWEAEVGAVVVMLSATRFVHWKVRARSCFLLVDSIVHDS